MFGEVVGAALADVWKRAGAPADAIYAELGPGRGTLAADALRVLRGAGFAGAVHFVETSPVLQEAQAKAVPGATWHENVVDLPAAPLLMVANEFFDALPIKQLIEGKERCVTVANDGLTFDQDGKIEELSPAREAAVAAIATCVAHCGGLAILIDYGHARTSSGDTLQAVRGHEYASVLADPGEQDLTSHVDFEALADTAAEADALVTEVLGQGEWLIRLGVEARAQGLSRANPDRASDLQSALERLTSREQMGELFKVMAIYSDTWPVPAGFA
jgi:SAM-dependent MidA family methyltransferase